MATKLRKYGITGNLISLLEHYLTHRSQRVIVNGKTSPSQPISSGISQGSVLGPLLILTYVSDVRYNILDSIKLVVDDTALFKEIDTLLNDFLELNNDNETLNVPILSPTLNNVSIKQVLCHKHLGLIFNDKMTWSDHIDDICKRSNKRLDIISKIRYLLPILCRLFFLMCQKLLIRYGTRDLYLNSGNLV